MQRLKSNKQSGYSQGIKKFSWKTHKVGHKAKSLHIAHQYNIWEDKRFKFFFQNKWYDDAGFKRVAAPLNTSDVG